MQFPEIAQRVFHTPLLAAPSKAAAFVKGLGPRLVGVDQVEFVGVEHEAANANGPARKPFASLLDDRLGEEIRTGRRSAYKLIQGVAVIPVTGTLIHRGAWVGSYSGETSYEGIGASIDAAANDSHVRGIALEIDSFGGQVAGCFDLCAQIREARERKSVQAFVCDHAFSAGYAIASQADKVCVPQAGGVGSIGVICLHIDYSQQLDDAGIRVSVISAGEHKADANPYEPLPDDVRASLEAEMESLRIIFAETVAAGRGDALSADAALATEAGCFLGAQAVEAGLADEVMSPREAFKAFLETAETKSTGSVFASTTKGKGPMSKQPPKPEGQAPEASTEDDDKAPAATPSTPAPTAAAPAPAPTAPSDPQPTADAATEERTRIMGILSCKEAEGREEQAQVLANTPGMTVESAKAILAAGPQSSIKGQLSATMSEDEADLDAPPTSTGAATDNPVKAAQKKRWDND